MMILFAEYENETEWDYALLRQELLMHYLLTVPVLEGSDPPTTVEGISEVAVEAARKAFAAKETALDEVKDEQGKGFSSRLLSLVMLNVLDEKWKDHLYDLDQLRGAIHYRSWGQKDPLIEYKQEAYTMFVDLMNDIHTTFRTSAATIAKVCVGENPSTPDSHPWTRYVRAASPITYVIGRGSSAFRTTAPANKTANPSVKFS